MNASIRKAALSALLPVLLGFAPLAAHAATFTFTGQNPTGTDPLGGTYQITNDSDGIYNLEESAGTQKDETQQPLFTPGQGLANATSFTINITGGDKFIPLSSNFGLFFETFKPNGNILSDWDVTENKAGTQITFTADSAADALVAGERFDFDVTFKKPVPDNFGYTITWGGAAAVPEPATWAMMIAGLGLIGGVLRRKNALGMAAA